MFCVTEFVDDESVAIVPATWLDEDGKSCLWPPVRHVSAADNLARKKCLPGKTWKVYSVRVLFSAGMDYANTDFITSWLVFKTVCQCLLELLQCKPVTPVKRPSS
jgi:hypothetical protein